MARNMMVKIMWMVFGILFLFSASAFSQVLDIIKLFEVKGYQITGIQNDNNNDGTLEIDLSIKYDGSGNPISMETDSDNDGNADERLLITQDANGHIIELNADPELANVTKDIKISLSYDETTGNLNRVDMYLSNDSTVDRYMEYRYTNGNLAELHDYNGDRHDTEIYTYDPGLNILTMKQKDKFSDKSIDVVTKYAYSEGKVSSESIDRDNDGTVDEIITYTYDETSGNLIKKETSGIIDKSTYNIENYTWTEVVAP